MGRRRPAAPRDSSTATARSTSRARPPSLGEKAADAEALEAKLEEAGLEPTPVDDAELARFLEAQGRLVRVGDGLAVGIGPYEAAKRALIEECERAGKITLARFRDLLGISRRPAQLLLERFDADGLTRRVGDERVLRRSAARALVQAAVPLAGVVPREPDDASPAGRRTGNDVGVSWSRSAR